MLFIYLIRHKLSALQHCHIAIQLNASHEADHLANVCLFMSPYWLRMQGFSGV